MNAVHVFFEVATAPHKSETGDNSAMDIRAPRYLNSQLLAVGLAAIAFKLLSQFPHEPLRLALDRDGVAMLQFLVQLAGVY